MSRFALTTEWMIDVIARLADGQPDDHEIPLGRLLLEKAEELGVTVRLDPDGIVTAGEIRRRCRQARHQLAIGDSL